MKPREETWAVTRHGGVGDASGPPHRWVAGFVQADGTASRPTEDDLARARLAAAAPEMARLLLDLEWAGDEARYRCPACEATAYPRHAPNCRLVAVLRKAGW